MRDIEHILGIVSRARYHLEAPRPIRLADALGDRLRRDLCDSLGVYILVVQFRRRCDCQRQVAQLMAPDQRRLDHDSRAHHVKRITIPDARFLAIVSRPLATQGTRASRRHRRHIWHGIHRARTRIEDCVADHVVRFGQLRQRNQNPAWPDNPRFFARNLRDSFAQILLMIERDIGNDAEARLNHVGRIQTPAHTNFKHNHVGPAAGEILKAYSGQHLKKARMPRQIAFPNQPLGCPVDHVMEHREIIVADRFAIKANPLIDTHQVRRCIEPRLQPRSLQDGCQTSRRRTLAVSASAASSTRMCARSNLCVGVCANSWPNAYICATAVS